MAANLKGASNSPSPQSARPPLRGSQVLGRLLAYHLLILGGGAVLLLGVARGAPIWIDGGVGLVVAGVGVYLAVVAWTVQLARQGTPVASGPSSAGPESVAPARHGNLLCSACGWRGDREPGLCPRCGKVLVGHRPRVG